MKHESKVNWLTTLFGVFVVFLLSSCNDTPMSARVSAAQNDEMVWEEKKLKEWRWDLRGFRNVQEKKRGQAELARVSWTPG